MDLVWLWHRPVATAPIQSLAWEHPDAVGAALKRQERKKEREREREREEGRKERKKT